MICSKCKKNKEESEFYKSVKCWCKKCHSKYVFEKRDPEAYKKYVISNWTDPKMIFSRKKANAKSEDIPFNIIKEEFVKWYNSQELKCHYCGITSEKFKDTNDKCLIKKRILGIDRKENALGYNLGNIVLCCNRCNIIKTDFFSHEEMQTLGKGIIKLKWKNKGIETG